MPAAGKVAAKEVADGPEEEVHKDALDAGEVFLRSFRLRSEGSIGQPKSCPEKKLSGADSHISAELLTKRTRLPLSS